MFVLLEAVSVAVVLGVVTIFFRAARARPEEPALKRVAWLALAGWVVFAASVLIDFAAIREDPMALVSTLVSVVIVGACVLGYRALLGRVRAKAAERGGP